MWPEERAGRCWYCGLPRLRVDDGREHVIPDAMGGTLTTDRVCQECNGRAGREIDAPFMRDFLVAMDRNLHVPGGAKLAPSIKARIEDDTPVDIRLNGRRPWTATVRSGIYRDGDNITIRASSRKEYDRLIERAKKQAEAEGRTFEPFGEPTEFETHGPVIVSSEVNGVTWLRMAAKITLGAMSKVVSDDWLDPAEAARYRSWLWDADPINEAGLPALAFPGEPGELDLLVNRPPQHLLFFSRTGSDATGLAIALFGTLMMRAKIDMGGLPRPDIGWRTGPGAPPEETSFDALLMEAALKKHAEPNEASG